MARPKRVPIYKRDYPTYKYRELIAAVGSDEDVQNLIREHGYEAPTVWVIRGWRTRNSIPARWLPILLMQAISEGLVSDISTFIAGVQDKKKRNVRKPKVQP
jgi:hypothetical protein